MSEQTQTLAPVATRAAEGEALWWLGGLAEIKVTGEQTGGLLSVLEIHEPPNPDGLVPPFHVHHREDEGFWMLEGSATFDIGDETIEASAGDFLWGPRDVPHRYSPGPDGCRLLFIMTPGGFENLVRAMSVPARERALPSGPLEEPDGERVDAVAREHGAEMLS